MDHKLPSPGSIDIRYVPGMSKRGRADDVVYQLLSTLLKKYLVKYHTNIVNSIKDHQSINMWLLVGFGLLSHQ